MRFAVLGPVQVESEAGVRQLPAGPQRLLLAVLLSRAGGPVTASQLVDALWPDEPSAKAVKNVQSYLTRLKRQLGEPARITLGPAGYAIAVGPGELDAQEFAEQLEQAAAARDSGDLDRAMTGYDRALRLWRGDPYAGLESCVILVPEIERLTELRLRALEDRAEVGLSRGRHTELVPELSALAAEHPYRERFSALLMLALYRSGRQAEALAAYQRTRTRLDEDLGIDPAPPLRDLHAAILRSDTALDLATEPSLKSPQPAQLPPDLASLTGRGTELEELLELAASGERSGTVVISSIDGMAGIGKTALALRAAHRLRERFPDGQLWINLHGFTGGVAAVEPLLALDRLLRAIGVPGEQIPGGCDERSALWRSRLAGRRMLIVLDNAASEDQVQPLLPASPGCLVLITSRRRLTDLDDVHPLTLDVLAPPDAIALFTRIVGEDRLAAESRQLTEEVVEFCGGLPLAIRILATRLRNRPGWTVADLADRLRDKRSRLGQIESARRSVAGAFRLSYDQLDALQQRLFRLTSLHPGAVFDTYAAAALTGLDLRETERGLEALVDAHLLQTRGYGRYIFHDLLRAHAADIATSEEPASDRRAALGRLLDYYLYAASRAMDQYLPSERRHRPEVPPAATPAPGFGDAEQAIRWLETEKPNLVALADYAADNGWAPYAMKFSACVFRYLDYRRCLTDALALHESALRAARSEGDQAGEARALNSLGSTYSSMEAFGHALSCYRQALRSASESGDVRTRASVLGNLGSLLYSIGHLGEAADYAGDAVEQYRANGDAAGEARALTTSGTLYRLLRRYREAERAGSRALEMGREAGDRSVQGGALILLGAVRCATASYEEALEPLEAALRLHREIGYAGGEFSALIWIGCAHRRLGRYAESLEAYQRIRDIATRIKSDNGLFEARLGMGETLLASGRPDEALHELRAAHALVLELEHPHDEARVLEALGDTFHDLGDVPKAREHWGRAWEIFERMGVPDADRVERALAELDERREM